MKKTAIAILIAVLVVAIGGGLCFAGLSAVHFDFKKLDRTEYLTRTYDFSDPIREIDLTCGTADVELIAAEDGRCRVVCFENERERYAVSNDDGRLTIRRETDERGWSLFSFAFKKSLCEKRDTCSKHIVFKILDDVIRHLIYLLFRRQRQFCKHCKFVIACDLI